MEISGDEDAQLVDISEFVGDVFDELNDILSNVYDLQFDQDSVICLTTLKQVATSTEESFLDARAKYQYNISAIKLVSLLAFWIIKLKPISNSGFVSKSSGKVVDFPDVNEQVAIYLAILQISQFVISGKLVEIISPQDDTVANLRRMIAFYYNIGFYRDVENEMKPVEGSEKIREVIHNIRFKRFTAVNIYEILTHIILPFRVMKMNG